MNRRGFFAALAGLPLAPVALKADPLALKADPLEGRLKKALALTNVPRMEIGPAWVEGTWRPVEWTAEELAILARHRHPFIKGMRRVEP